MSLKKFFDLDDVRLNYGNSYILLNFSVVALKMGQIRSTAATDDYGVVSKRLALV